MSYQYLVYVIFFATIIIPSLIIIFCYSAIYRRIIKEEKNIKCLLRASERRRRMRNRRKLIRTLFMLVIIYAICWFPLYLLNTFDWFFPNNRTSSIPTLATVVLSHVNCAVNPLIYSYGLPGFKQALRRFLGIRSATVKSPQLYNNMSHVPVNSQRYKDMSTVRGYIVDCARKSSKSPSLFTGQSIDSVDTFLTPLNDSHKRSHQQLQAINEASSVSMFSNNNNNNNNVEK